MYLVYLLIYSGIPILVCTIVILLACKRHIDKPILSGIIAGSSIGSIVYIVGVFFNPCAASVRICDYFLAPILGALFGGAYGLNIALIYKLVKKIHNMFQKS